MCKKKEKYHFITLSSFFCRLGLVHADIEPRAHLIISERKKIRVKRNFSIFAKTVTVFLSLV
jgi:hypothetical protein